MPFAAGEEERISVCPVWLMESIHLTPFILAADIKDGEPDLLKFRVVLA